jgi:16S rRNA processing protein RimM
VMPATDDVAGVYAQGRGLRLGDAEGQPYTGDPILTVAAAREFKGGVIVHFEKVEDRNAAELLKGRTLLIPAEEARPLEDGEFFFHDLVGLEVLSADGVSVGRVVEVYEGGAVQFLGVSDGEHERLIPFAEAVVREVDIDGGRVVIEAIPGLLDL